MLPLVKLPRPAEMLVKGEGNLDRVVEDRGKECVSSLHPSRSPHCLHICTLHIANALLSDLWGYDPEKEPGAHNDHTGLQRPGAGRSGALLVQWLSLTHLLAVTLRLSEEEEGGRGLAATRD